MLLFLWLTQLRERWLGKALAKRRPERDVKRRRSVRPWLESLETRITPTTHTLNVNGGDTAGLINAINQANSAALGAGNYVINLDANGSNAPYVVTTGNNFKVGENGLPVITAKNLTINGNGATIERSSSTDFRLFYISGHTTVTLENLTLAGGAELGYNGGAIYAAGSKLTLSNDLIEHSSVTGKNGGKGKPGQTVEGGGLYSAGGTITINNGTVFLQNSATGGNGGAGGKGAVGAFGANGANGSTSQDGGGGLDGGKAGNGTNGANGGNGLGGGAYFNKGTINLVSVLFTGNTATGGNGGDGGTAGVGGFGGKGGSGGNGADNLQGGNGGKGGDGGGGGDGGVGGNGGNGGNGQGAGFYATSASITLGNTQFSNNHASGGTGGKGGEGGIGGFGGKGGNGGNGGEDTAHHDTIPTGLDGNGGDGGDGGDGGNGGDGGDGGNGGNAIGAAAYVNAGSITFASGAKVNGQLDGVAAGAGGKGGASGPGGFGGKGGAGGAVLHDDSRSAVSGADGHAGAGGQNGKAGTDGTPGTAQTVGIFWTGGSINIG
jgi:hypothetical protein